ncbi:MAG: ribonuclease P protein component [Pseudomonadota bacterium]
MLRLRKRHEYEAVFAYDCVVSSRLFVVRAKPNGLSSPRLGIVASKKVLPRAVDRNRGKRLARETFRLALHGLAALDIVVQLRTGLAKRGLAKRNNGIARQELLTLFAGLDGRLASREPPSAGAAVEN